MMKRSVLFFLSAAMINLLCYEPAIADSHADRDARRIEKVRTALNKLGVGADARVSIKLLDKTKIKGYIREKHPDHFVVVDDMMGNATLVSYSSVKQMKGNNLSTGTIITVGIILALVITIAILTVAKEDG